MTNNMGKHPGPKRNSRALPPLEGGNKSPGSARRSPPPTAEGRRRTRSVEPANLPTLEPCSAAWPALQHSASVESVAAGRPPATTAPSSPRREPARARGGSFRLHDGLQHRQPLAQEPEQPIAAPRGGKPLNLQPMGARRAT